MPVPKDPGPYYRADYPLLGIITAVTCGSESERKKFWATGAKPTDPAASRKFCSERYGLSDEQTALFLETLPNVVVGPNGNTYKPVSVHTRKVMRALIKELSVESKIGRGSAIPLDPDRIGDYPIIAGLYDAPTPTLDESQLEAIVSEVVEHPTGVW